MCAGAGAGLFAGPYQVSGLRLALDCASRARGRPDFADGRRAVPSVLCAAPVAPMAALLESFWMISSLVAGAEVTAFLQPPPRDGLLRSRLRRPQPAEASQWITED